MIREDNTNILSDYDGNNVIIHPVNCRGVIGPGLAHQINRRYPEWYNEFNGYCMWFNKSTWNSHDHFNEIMGSFHRYQPNEHTIICSAFVQEEPTKGRPQPDFEAWAKILKKVERQTIRAKKVTGQIWTLHIPMNICTQETLDGESLMPIIEEIFMTSEVDVVIHNPPSMMK